MVARCPKCLTKFTKRKKDGIYFCRGCGAIRKIKKPRTGLENREENIMDNEVEFKDMNKVTAEYMQSRITDVEYSQPFGTVTICNIKLDNGFSVRGESACVDPDNFDEAKGQMISYKNAFDKLWVLFGFALMEAKYNDR